MCVLPFLVYHGITFIIASVKGCIPVGVTAATRNEPFVADVNPVISYEA